MGCSSLQSETWHCRIFRKLAYMKKLLAVLIAGSFAAGAFAQAAAPRSLPPLPPQPQPPHRTIKQANLPKSIICSTAAKRCTSQPDRALKAVGDTGTKPLYAGLTHAKACRTESSAGFALRTGSGRLFATAICTATHADCYRLVTSDFLFGMQGS
jgi:hypothetical protein